MNRGLLMLISIGDFTFASEQLDELNRLIVHRKWEKVSKPTFLERARLKLKIL